MSRVAIDGRTAVISGAGSGIGRALAQRLAAAGCPVALTDWDADGLAETAATIDGPVLTRELDVRDYDAQLAWAEEVRAWTPEPIGLVCNNAGVVITQWAAEAELEHDRWLMDINYWGVVHGARAFLPILLEQGSGSIVNVSSILGLTAFPTQTAYCAAKSQCGGTPKRFAWSSTAPACTPAPPTPVACARRSPAAGACTPTRSGGPTPRPSTRDFETAAHLSPQGAARIIHEGAKSGQPRIIVGWDARLMYAVAHALPTRYFVPTRLAMPVAGQLLSIARQIGL